MSDPTLDRTRPQDRVSLSTRLVNGLGSLVNNLLGAAIGMMSVALHLGPGKHPAAAGTVLPTPRLTDAFTDPVMGFISDRTRCRWGRRRPHDFFGACLGPGARGGRRRGAGAFPPGGAGAGEHGRGAARRGEPFDGRPPAGEGGLLHHGEKARAARADQEARRGVRTDRPAAVTLR